MKVTTSHYRIGNVIQTVRMHSYELSDFVETVDEVEQPLEDSRIKRLPKPTTEFKEFDSINAAKRYNRLELRCTARKAVAPVHFKLIEGSKRRHSRYKVMFVPEKYADTGKRIYS